MSTGDVQLTKHAVSNSMATRLGPATWYVASICRNPLRKLRPDKLKSTRFEAWHDATSMLCTKLPSEMKLRSPSLVRRLPCNTDSRNGNHRSAHLPMYSSVAACSHKQPSPKACVPHELSTEVHRDGYCAEQQPPVSCNALQISGDAVCAAVALQLLYKVEDGLPLLCLH
jgi:hypothetical protein